MSASETVVAAGAGTPNDAAESRICCAYGVRCDMI